MMRETNWENTAVQAWSGGPGEGRGLDVAVVVEAAAEAAAACFPAAFPLLVGGEAPPS